MIYALWAVVAFQIFGAFASIYKIGKPVKPTTPGMAIAVVVFAGLICLVQVLAITQLGG